MRTMLLAMLVGVLLLGALRWYTESFRAQEQAIAAIREAGGSVKTEPDNSAWLHWLVGAEMPQAAIGANLGDCEMTESLFQSVMCLDGLRALTLGGEGVAEEHMDRLASMTRLKHLMLDSTAVGEDAVNSLRDSRPYLNVYISHWRMIRFLRNQRGVYVRTDPWETPSSPWSTKEFGSGSPIQFITTLIISRPAKINGAEVTDGVLAELQISRLTGLKYLSIHCASVTDDGLDFLSNLKGLRKLDLSGTRITDKILRQLRHLKHLERLELKFTQITQAGCKYLAHPEKLKWLDVGWTDVDDLSFLSTATGLKYLGLSSCAIGDDQLRHVRSLPRLQHLDICDVPLTGAGLRHFSGLESLAELNLLGASLTDEALDPLHDLPNLRHLRISGRIDDGAIARLKDALPNLATFWCDASQAFSSEAPTPKSKRSAWAAHARSKAPQQRMPNSRVTFFSLNGKYGFKTSDGRVIAPARFEDVGDFTEGLAAVKLGGKWGYIDRTGMLTIQPRFDYANHFSEAHAAVVVNGKQGFINTKGTFIIEPKYDPSRSSSSSSFSEGVANVSRDGKWGFVNVAGKEVIPLIYQGARGFSEGLAAVKIGNKWGYIDRSGRIVVEPQYKVMPSSFWNGQAGVGNPLFGEVNIDRTGKFTAMQIYHMR
ncbi:MAG: WG repeat-containing protein [Planctomycetes bacterium]|nr:WG repeat-containing protein [Planctomycetota bacterium]